MSLIGKQIAHYLIEEKIGEGGMGIVYKAEDTKLKRKVALKFLKPEALGNEQEKARFLREAQTAAALDHPNICTIFEVNEFEGNTYIAMAFIDGQNIDEKLEAGPLSIEEAITIALQVAEGLQAANEMGVVHRDIKSANIMVTTAKQQVKIMDFGLAKLAGQAKKLTLSGMTPGTVAYMSPEQARGEEVDHLSDIWSLGVVLYEMITGKLPFKGEYERAMLYSIMSEEPEPITDLRTDVPVALEQIIYKSLQKNKEDRYQIVDEMLIDLQQMPLDIPSIALKKPMPKIKAQQPAKIEKSKTMLLIFLGLAIAFAVFIIISIFYRKSETGKTIRNFVTQITFSGRAKFPAISPDGKFLAYASEDTSMIEKVFVQDITGGEPVGQAIEVFRDRIIEEIRWSPNGSELLISSINDSTGASYIVPRLGGISQKIAAPRY